MTYRTWLWNAPAMPLLWAFGRSECLPINQLSSLGLNDYAEAVEAVESK